MRRNISSGVVLLGFDTESAYLLRNSLSEYDIRVAGSVASVDELISAYGADKTENSCEQRPAVTVIMCSYPDETVRGWICDIKTRCAMETILVTVKPCLRSDAEAVGAFGCVGLPQAPNSNVLDFRTALMLLVRNARLSVLAASMGFNGKWMLFPGKKDANRGAHNIKVSEQAKTDLRNIKLLAIGASAGGTEALMTLLTDFTPDMPPVAIVQHMPKDFVPLFADTLNKKSTAEIQVACDGDLLRQGHIYIAPGAMQMTIKCIDDKYGIRVSEGEKISGHCPSVDVLFSSVADCAGSAALGVILTGMGADGAEGLLKMRRAGAYTIGQDEESCVVYGMPRAAYELGAVTQQAPLDDIAVMIKKLIGCQEAAV